MLTIYVSEPRTISKLVDVAELEDLIRFIECVLQWEMKRPEKLSKGMQNTRSLLLAHHSHSCVTALLQLQCKSTDKRKVPE